MTAEARRRLVLAVALCAVAAGAQAQLKRQLEVELPAAAGFLISDSDVATASDGGHVVLLMQQRQAQAGDRSGPSTEQKVELVGFSRDGVQRFRQLLFI